MNFPRAREVRSRKQGKPKQNSIQTLDTKPLGPHDPTELLLILDPDSCCAAFLGSWQATFNHEMLSTKANMLDIYIYIYIKYT